MKAYGGAARRRFARRNFFLVLCGLVLAGVGHDARAATTLTLDFIIGIGNSQNVANNDSLTLLRGGTGTLTNNGTVNLNSTGSFSNLILSGGAITFAGNGSVTLSNNLNNRIYGATSSDTLTNAASHTIQGAGQIGLGITALTNQGLIIANQSAGLSIDPNTSGMINTGTLRATNGATLRLENGAFNNTGGLIEAQNNSFVDLSAATITGGTLASSGTGHFHALGSSTLASLTISSGSLIELANAQRLNLSGAIANSGTISLLAAGNSTDLVFATDTTLSGGGAISLSNSPNNRIYGAASTTTFINQNNTISGSGQLGVNFLQLDNRSLIDANQASGTLTIDLSGTGGVNTGTMQATNGGILRLQGTTLNNNGGNLIARTGSKLQFDSSTISNGTITVQSGGILELDTVTVSGGTLANAGSGIIRTTGGASTLGSAVTNSAGGEIQVTNNTTLQLSTGGSFSNAGNIALNGVGNNTNLVMTGGDVTLTGAGTLTLSNSANNRIYGASSTERLINGAGHTIQGSGQLGVGLLAFTNQGTVIANQSLPLTLDPNAAGAINTGTLRATNNATLEITNGAYTNTGGTLEAQTGSTVRFENAQVTGGTLVSSGTGHLLNAATNTFTNVTIASGSIFDFNNATTATFGGTLTNQGQVALNAAGNTTDFAVAAGGLTLAGGGTITLSNTGNSRFIGTATLVNLDNSIRGAGQIGVNEIQLDNRGLIEASVSGAALTLDPSNAGAVNTGTLQATGGGILQLQNGAFNNAGGLVRAQAGSTVRLDSATVSGGTFDVAAGASLALSNATINGGTLNGASSGIISTVSGSNTLGGTVTVNAGTQLTLLNNTSLRLLSGGSFAHNGTLTLSSAGNFTDLTISGGDVIFNGTGAIVLGDNPNNRIYGSTTTDRLVLNSGIALRGAGQVGVGLLGLSNAGLIEASQPANALVLNPNASGVTNTGTLRATAGATLRLTSGTYTNTGGVIEAQNTSRVQFESAVVTGGTLLSTGAGRLVNASSTTYTGITLAAGSVFDFNNNTSGTLGGAFTNQATVNLNSAGNFTDFVVAPGGLTLNGSGIIALGDNPNNRIYGNTSSGIPTLVNQSNTIRGAGQIGVNLLAIDNRATIEANLTGSTLEIDSGGSGVTNTGTLQAVNGGILLLQNSTVNNAGGTIRADTGSNINLSSSTVSGGTLATVSTGVIRTVSGTSTLDGTLTIATGGQVTLNNNTGLVLLSSGLYHNNGTITLASAGNFTDLRVSGGDVTVTGAGTILLGNNANNRIYGNGGSDRLVNASGHTIQGSGQVGVGLMGLLNQGLVVANQATPLTIDPSAAGVTNPGRLRADIGSTLRLQNGTFTNTSGTIEASGAGAVVEFNNATVVNGTLLSGVGASLHNLGNSNFNDVTLAPGSSLELLNNTLAHVSGTLINQASLLLSSAGNFTDLVLSSDVTLDGGGTITLGNNPNNRIYGSLTTNRLINHNNTIVGAGQLGVGLMGLVNEGAIRANQSATLAIDPSSMGVINTGLLRADSGGTLLLRNGAFTNTGGTIEAVGAGSVVQFNGANVSNGLLRSSGGGLLTNVLSSTFNNTTLDGGSTLQILNNTSATLTGTLTNGGVVQLLSAGNFTDLVIGSGGAMLSGHGVIDLSNNPNNRIYGVTGATTLNNVDNTIRGSGQLGANQLTLLNTGTIEASQSTPLTVNLASASPFTNQGTLRATNGGQLIFTENVTNAAVVNIRTGSTFTGQGTFTQSGGATMLESGTLTATSHAFQGGVLQGSGTINGAVSNGSSIAPGANGSGTGTGLLTFNQSLTLTPTSLLLLEIGGLTDFDRIQASTIVLNGSFTLTFANSFQSAIQPTDTFTLLSTTNATGLSGTFAGFANGSRIFTADGFGSFQVNYLANGFTLSNFAAVPEPSTYALLALGGMVMFFLRRRHRRHPPAAS